MTDFGRLRGSSRYQRQRAAFYRLQGPFPACSICNELIDMALSGRHRDGRSVDHRIAVAAGGDFWDLANWRVAHRRCNSSKGVGAPVTAGPDDPRFCWKLRSGTWEKVSPNDIRCEVAGDRCPHPNERKKT